MINLKRLVLGDDSAIVEAGSQGERDMKALGFKDPAAKKAAPKRKAPAKKATRKG